MTVKRQFPASIVDEITYSVESAYNSLHLVYSWIFSLEGEVNTEITWKALDRALDYYPKCRCILVNNFPSYKRWFRYRWEHTETTGKDILQEIELSDPTVSIRDVVDHHVRNHVTLSIDLSSHIPLKILLIRTPQRTFFSFINLQLNSSSYGFEEKVDPVAMEKTSKKKNPQRHTHSHPHRIDARR